MIFGLILLILHGNLINGRPNIVLIFADDMGYGDLHSYGHPTQEYGAIDKLAAEGVRFTQWYSADSLCTPSRAALLTGRLPIRSGMVGPRRVLHVDDAGGLPKNETTIAEALREQGYSTGMVGKWHLGIYGDNLNEMAWAVGEVVGLLRQLQIDRNTLVLFISDNGPALELCFHGGSSGFLKGGKATTWDGGIRVPAIAWWPGTIQPGINTQVLSSVDVFPTLLQLAGGNSRNNGNLDGKSIADLLFGNHDIEIHKILFHYCSDRLMAVRFGKYKIHYHTQPLPRYGDNCPDGNPIEDLITGLGCYENTTTHTPPLIYNIEADPSETHPLDPRNHQKVLEEVEARIKAHKATIAPVKSQLGNSREILKPCCNPSTCVCNYPASVTKKTEL